MRYFILDWGEALIHAMRPLFSYTNQYKVVRHVQMICKLQVVVTLDYIAVFSCCSVMFPMYHVRLSSIASGMFVLSDTDRTGELSHRMFATCNHVAR